MIFSIIVRVEVLPEPDESRIVQAAQQSRDWVSDKLENRAVWLPCVESAIEVKAVELAQEVE